MLIREALRRAPNPARRGALACVAGLIASVAVVVPAAQVAAPVVAVGSFEITAWVPYFSSNAATSLAAHSASMSESTPFFYTVKGISTIAADGSASQREAILSAARTARTNKGTPIIATIVDGMDPLGMATILADPAQRTQHVQSIVQFLATNGFDGIDLDYETFAFEDGRTSWQPAPTGLDTFTNWGSFLTELGAALHAASPPKRLEVSVPPIYNAKHDDTAGYWVYNYPVMNTVVDRVKVMMYDYSVSKPGSLAPYNWVNTTMDYIKTVVDPGKLLLGIPAYGRDWVTKVDGSCPVSAIAAKATSRRNPLMSAIFQNASKAGQVPTWNTNVHEYTYSYVESFTGPDSNAITVRCNVYRTVWFGDARSIGERTKLAFDKGLGGVAIWALGYEDQATWDALAAGSSGQSPNAPGPLAANLTAPAVLPPYPAPIDSSGPLPARYLDTRAGYKTSDGQYQGKGSQPAGSTFELPIAGRGPVPGGTTAVTLNVTVIGKGDGYVTVFPCGTQPATSSLNVRSGQTASNTVVTKLSAAGSVCIYTQQAADLIVDVFNVLPDDSITTLATPARVLDTRPGQPTIDGTASGNGALPISGVVEVPIAGRGGMSPVAKSAVLNVTAVDAAAPGFLTVWPCDSPQPSTSNVNYVRGAATPNAVVTALSASGTVCVYSSNPANVIIDVFGEFAPADYAAMATPARLMETRSGGSTTDGQFNALGKSAAGHETTVMIAGRGGMSATTSTAILNVTVDAPEVAGYVTVYACGTARPPVSNVNYAPGQTVPNLVVTKLSATGTVCIYTNTTTHVIVDVFGTLTI